MKLSDKLSYIYYLDKDTKDIYINAGFVTIKDVLNSDFDTLSQIGKKHKYNYFRNLLRCIHNNNLVFNFEKEECFKDKIINEDIDIHKLDFSNYMINILLKNKIYDSKTLYNLLKNEPYKVYKICRNSILNELTISKCWYLKNFFDLDVKKISGLEDKYIEENKFYDKFLLEFNYLILYFINNDISIDKLQLKEKTKSELLNNNIYSLIDLIIDFRFIVIEEKNFHYRICSRYDYGILEDIIIYLKEVLNILNKDNKYINFKYDVCDKTIKEFDIDKELVVKFGLGNDDSIIKLVDRYIDFDIDNLKECISNINRKCNLVKKKV